MKKIQNILIIIMSVMLCASHNLMAQDTLSVKKSSGRESNDKKTENYQSTDSVVVTKPGRSKGKTKTTIIDVTNDSIPKPVKSVVKREGDPMKAAMMSVVFPGGGQIYNRKYWKLPIVYAGFGVLVYSFRSNSNNYQLYYKGYMDFTDDIKETTSYLDLVPYPPESYDPVLYPDTYNPANAQQVEEKLLRLVDYHKRYRDLSIILTGVWYLAQILDANVDASLMQYDVSDNLDLTFFPAMINIPGRAPGTTINLALTVTF